MTTAAKRLHIRSLNKTQTLDDINRMPHGVHLNVTLIGHGCAGIAHFETKPDMRQLLIWTLKGDVAEIHMRSAYQDGMFTLLRGRPTYDMIGMRWHVQVLSKFSSKTYCDDDSDSLKDLSLMLKAHMRDNRITQVTYKGFQSAPLSETRNYDVVGLRGLDSPAKS